MENQCQRIINYCNQFGSITTREAFIDLGIARLASRIHDLRMSGYVIEDEFVESENRYGEKVRYKRYTVTGDRVDNIENNIIGKGVSK